MNPITNEATWKVFLKRNRSILIIGGLVELLGFWADVQWFPRPRSMDLYLINLFPGLILLLTWFLSSTFPKMRWGLIIIGILITFVGSFIIVFLNLAAAAFDSATRPIDDVSQYTEIRGKLGDSEIVRHFPLSIPNNATDIKFAYLPGFLQGGGYMQLGMKLPPSEINNLLTEYHSKAKYKFIGDDTSDYTNKSGDKFPPFPYPRGTDDSFLKDDYEILVINAQPQGTPDFQWNHGYSYGVVISAQKSEIVYWGEGW